MIDLVREFPGGAATVVLVGHEPGVSRLVLQLADRANAAERGRISAKFPTCAAAVLAVAGAWAGAVPGSATLEWFRTPRD
jgi:phosphohistidine phosphatase